MRAPARYIAAFVLFAPRARTAIALGVVAAAFSVPGASATAATAQQAIALLDMQRAANGLPAGLTENSTFSSDCALHDNYMALNHQLTHDEEPGNPGYTADGAYAGRNAVLTENASWDTGNPYETQPLHLDQLLAPRLQTLGSADQQGFSCTTTFPGWTRPDPPALTVYTYPGNGAQIYASEIARELPWTPGQLVNIPSGSRTGPYLIVLVDAPGQSPFNNPATISDASLTGPAGAVQVQTVDGTTAVTGGQAAALGPYISPGGFVIPVKPLAAGTTYEAHVVVGFAGGQTAHDWTFTTIGSDPRSALTARGGRLAFNSLSPRPASVTFTRAGGRRAPTVTIAPGNSVRLKLVPGSWQACGRQPATSRFSAYEGCITVVVIGTPSLRLGVPTFAGTKLTFPLRFSAVLRGRTAMLTVTPLTVRCHGHACPAVPGRPVSRAIVLRAKTLRFPLPAPGTGIALALDTAAFQLADAPWAAASASARFVRR